MKSISNILLITIASLWGIFWTAEKSVDIPHPAKTRMTDTSNSAIIHNIDSMNILINQIDEKTLSPIKTDNKILQNTKKEFMHLDLCLDTLHASTVLENDNVYILPSVK